MRRRKWGSWVCSLTNPCKSDSVSGLRLSHDDCLPRSMLSRAQLLLNRGQLETHHESNANTIHRMGPSSDVNKVVRLKDGRVWHGPSLGLGGSGVCEIKYRFDFLPGGFLAALPPSGSKLSATSNDPNLSEKRYRFCTRACPFDASTTLTSWGKGAPLLAGMVLGRYLFSQTPG